jgi:hypothetical protein
LGDYDFIADTICGYLTGGGYPQLAMRRRSDLSDIVDPSGFRFQFSISIEEDRFFQKLVSDRLKRHTDWEASAVQGLVIAAVVMISGLLSVALEWTGPQTFFVLIVCFVLGEVFATFVTAWTSVEFTTSYLS